MRLSHTTRVRTSGYGEYAYVYNTATGYRSLADGVAPDILEQLRAGATLRELADAIMRTYDVDDRAMVLTDCTLFLAELFRNGCLEDVEPELAQAFEESAMQMDAAVSETVGDAKDPDQDFDAELRAVCEQNNTLEHAYFELTYRCNARCIHCYEEHCPSSAGELTYGELCRVLDELRAMNTMQVTFTGGEVSMRRDFIDICRYATQLGFVVHVYTNGTGFSNDELKALAAMDLGSVSVSLYCPDAASHDAITRLPGSFDRTRATLAYFKRHGVRTCVKTILLTKTLPGMRELIDLVAAEGHELELSLQVLASQMGAYDADALRVHDVDELTSIIRYEQEAMGRETPSIRPGTREHVCGIGRSLNITPTGDITPCNVLTTPVGNVCKSSIEQVWCRSRELAVLRCLHRNHLCSKCRSCDLFDYCLYCPGQSWREMGTISVPCPANCELARAKARAYGAAGVS